jgi:hypothetical protein
LVMIFTMTYWKMWLEHKISILSTCCCRTMHWLVVVLVNFVTHIAIG